MKPSTPSPWPPIIESSRAPWAVRLRDILLTLAAWALLLYLLRDEISLAIDYFSEPIFKLTRTQAPDWAELWRRLSPFVYWSLAGMTWLTMWAVIHRRRLRRAARVTPPTPLPLEDHAASLCVDPCEIERWREWRILTVHFENDRITTAEPGAPPAIPPGQ